MLPIFLLGLVCGAMIGALVIALCVAVQEEHADRSGFECIHLHDSVEHPNAYRVIAVHGQVTKVTCSHVRNAM